MNEIITLISHEGFGLNTNILETNIINISLLIGLLIYSFTDVIKSTLKEREESISLNLDTAANKLIFANQQFKDAEEALAAIRLKAKEIKIQTITQKEQLVTSEIQKFKNELVSEIGSYKKLLAERKRYLDNETYFSYLKLAKTN
jgi:F0F1-type ATP synthase membrane subunit b/b'